MNRSHRVLATLACLGLLACGGGGGGSTQGSSTTGGGGGGATLTISPSAPKLNPGQRFFFDATLTGASGAVAWTVVEPGGGYQETLTDRETLYTAPAAPGTYHLAAQAPGGATAQATITVLAPAARISVRLNPASAALQPGEALTFAATVANTTNQTVGWAVEEAGGGMVDANGAYTAPYTPGLYHLVAWSQDDDAAIGEASILVGPAAAPASLQVSPLSADVAPGQPQAFTAALFHAAGPVAWSVTEAGGGTITSSGLYTAPATPGLYHVHAAGGAATADIPIHVVAPVTTRGPRIWLDAATLIQLRARAAAHTAAWQALKARCDVYLAGPVNLPDGNGYPDTGVGQGYQGSDYYEAVLDLGLAYQALKPTDAASANAYAAKGVEVLMAMSDMGPHAQPPTTDDGYGIRFYVSGMALGFDWLHDQLSAFQRQQVMTAMGNWIAFFEQSGFENANPPGITNPPNGNYFAGYYAAKALAALAAEGEDPQAPARWTDWLDRVHGRMVQPDYALYMAGGGAPEGWNYSPFATKNMIYPTLAAKTAKGLDLVNDPARPFAFPFDQGPYLIHFTWPTRLTLDDRGTLYNSDNPAATQVGLSSALAYLQSALGAPSAPFVHTYARDIRTLQGNDGSTGLWEDLLFWDDAAPEADTTTLPLSYHATGNGEVAMRSSWATDAVWASFRSAPYIANGGGGHEYFDQGGLAIVRGGTPFLINSTGEFERNTPGTSNGGTWDDAMYGNLFDSKVRDIFNVFYVKTASGDYGQAAYDPTIAGTALTHVEDGGGYVRMRGEKLEELYRPGGPEPAAGGAVVAWTRDVVYLRPQLFVVYDRTQASTPSADQWMAWHFGKVPAEGAAPQAGAHRWDITYNGTYAGAMTTLLPAGNTTSLVDVFSSGKVYRVEVRPGMAAATQRWLTVLDAAASGSAVEKATRLSSADGNVTAGAVQGVLLQGATSNQAVLFGTGAAGATIGGTLTFTVPAVATILVLTDLPASADYTVTATLAAGKLTVQATPGAGFTTTATGTLYLSLAATGVVSAGP
ncbi:MAG TPA: hypothetical protein VJ483_06940 [Holophagaceae bacterium]|nr:hypothetical protein [Holophagaceae bacterium]